MLIIKILLILGIDSLIEYAIKAAKDLGYCKIGERVIVIQGIMQECPESTNIIKVVNVN